MLFLFLKGHFITDDTRSWGTLVPEDPSLDRPLMSSVEVAPTSLRVIISIRDLHVGERYPRRVDNLVVQHQFATLLYDLGVFA